MVSINRKEMKKIIIAFGGFIVLLWLFSCDRLGTDFRDFLGENEIKYTGAVGEVHNKPGNLRTQLVWKASSDPTITKYVIYWNGKRDSAIVDVDGRPDSIYALITGLQEYTYSFTIHSFDAKGNKSIPKEVNNIRVYGDVYKNGLLNRAINADRPYLAYSSESTILNFLAPDTINIHTRIRYENMFGQTIEKTMGPNEQTMELNDYKLGTDILYRSSYIPVTGAIDTFEVNDFDVFPEYVFQNVECDKGLFGEIKLLHDVGSLSESPLRNLWNGKREAEGYPNIFHSQGNIPLPHTFTFDLGKIYNNLSQFEQIGRDCCHNPVEFEVWGTADITNADTELPSNNEGWMDESLQKGWVLLADIVRNDDGIAPRLFEITSPSSPVRYIRIRVKRNANGDTWQSNMSEITFWNYQ